MFENFSKHLVIKDNCIKRQFNSSKAVQRYKYKIRRYFVYLRKAIHRKIYPESAYCDALEMLMTLLRECLSR